MNQKNDDSIRATADDFTDTVALEQRGATTAATAAANLTDKTAGEPTGGSPTGSEDLTATQPLSTTNDQSTDTVPISTNDADTVAFPEIAAYKALSEAPTQTLYPERIKAQTAQTVTMPPLDDTDDKADGGNEDGNEDGNGDATVPMPLTPMPLTMADLTDDKKTDEAEPQQPIAYAEPVTPITSATPTPQPDDQDDQKATADAAEHHDATDADARQREAWDQQQSAAQEYADEAKRNSYPGSGAAYQQTTGAGTPYANYPGWNQYAPNMAGAGAHGPAGMGPGMGAGMPMGAGAAAAGMPMQPPAPAIEYKTGPNAPTIVWGVIVALVAVAGLAGAWMFGTSPTSWSVMLILVLVVLGMVLVIGGVAAAFRRPDRRAADRKVDRKTSAGSKRSGK
ncbi:hypothetical protein [Bifidobacterium simiarum]|uniref:Uncharacterized protein n=1 Tax=Bifidobacterium simiarum TaxID=2045441 RepID=A0A2M9HG69_9BIFI|nr:hypothetical protein [Bifidobacterium simiarum]PJM75796.1 hypothetical protein CSQ87_02670 [Bifidobacterium simiarum]